MNDQRENIPWVDANQFNENFNKFPSAELLKFAGQHVAFSLDGTQILASGVDEMEMERRLKESGIDPSRVVGMYLPSEDEDLLL